MNAAALNRSRAGEVPTPKLELDGKRSLVLRFPSGWLAEHPLTAADLELETRYLEPAGFDLDVR